MTSRIKYMNLFKEGILHRTIMHLFQRCRSYECKAAFKEIDSPECVVSYQFIEENIERNDLQFSIVNFLIE